ncbi:MAG: hypothetical protein KAS76_00885 [Thermoplasmatales archaeon]|nr:hypothetical protein [Thermoplasmatales archaeon]
MDIFRKIGSWLFLLGIIIAVIVGIVVGAEWYIDANSYIAALLGALGFIVGVLSFFALGQITQERVPTFLIAALTLVGIGALSPWTFGSWAGLAPYLTGITQYIAIFAAPAAGLLAIRAIWDAGKTEEIERVIPKLPK